MHAVNADVSRRHVCHFFFFNDTATTEIYTLSLHDALPISRAALRAKRRGLDRGGNGGVDVPVRCARRSEEHTSELQSQSNLVCRLLLEKKKKRIRGAHRQALFQLPGIPVITKNPHTKNIRS